MQVATPTIRHFVTIITNPCSRGRHRRFGGLGSIQSEPDADASLPRRARAGHSPAPTVRGAGGRVDLASAVPGPHAP